MAPVALAVVRLSGGNAPETGIYKRGAYIGLGVCGTRPVDPKVRSSETFIRS